MLSNWQSKISLEIQNKIDLNKLEKKYYYLIQYYFKKGFPERLSLIKAKKEMIVYLNKYDIKNSDIIYILHFCGIAIYPKIYKGCGCHSYFKRQ